MLKTFCDGCKSEILGCTYTLRLSCVEQKVFATKKGLLEVPLSIDLCEKCTGKITTCLGDIDV